MGEEGRRRCCLLGGCGCGPPGSLAQRQAMKEWTLEKLKETHLRAVEDDASLEAMVDRWLDELPWKVEASE